MVICYLIYFRTYTHSLMHCYEVIPEGAVCKLYFDLEFYKPSNNGADGETMVSSLIQVKTFLHLNLQYISLYSVQIYLVLSSSLLPLQTTMIHMLFSSTIIKPKRC